MQDIKQRVALTWIAASGGLAKGVVGPTTGSLAILSEAALRPRRRSANSG
jgi:hypothetical protein